MSYRTLLLERRRQSDALALEPSVLSYIDVRNQQCLDAWRRRRFEHERAALLQSGCSIGSTEPERR